MDSLTFFGIIARREGGGKGGREFENIKGLFERIPKESSIAGTGEKITAHKEWMEGGGRGGRAEEGGEERNIKRR